MADNTNGSSSETKYQDIGTFISFLKGQYDGLS